jgi:hypothetical protein
LRGQLDLAKRAAVLAAALAWMAFWFWTFSCSYSSSFFVYNRHSRLPVFGAALFAAAAILVSGWRQWSSRRAILVACVRHAAWSALALVPFVIVSGVLMRAPHPWRPSADDAMGTGIDFMILCALAIVSVLLLALALAVRGMVSRGEPPS